jgi:hypothetical protein
MIKCRSDIVRFPILITCHIYYVCREVNALFSVVSHRNSLQAANFLMDNVSTFVARELKIPIIVYPVDTQLPSKYLNCISTQLSTGSNNLQTLYILTHYLTFFRRKVKMLKSSKYPPSIQSPIYLKESGK